MRSIPAALLLLAFGALPVTAGAQAAPGAPRVFAHRGELLLEAKQRVRAGDPALAPAYRRLLKDADAALKAGPFSVMDKKRLPPSGDRHDYMSFGPYWWPDPSKPDGLPYIRRDGERNPEIYNDTDSRSMDRMVGAVDALALAYFFSGEERYAAHAADLLRTWFVTPATRMNPNLDFGQAIPGVTQGRGIGIIETRDLTGVVDDLGLLAGSKALTDADLQGIRGWMGSYLEWLLTSKNGLDEKAWFNNHGTWYDAQASALALYLGRTDLAREILSGTARLRIDDQITKEGAQPEELARTRSLSYSVMNLDGFSQLAELSRRVGLDLWSYEAPRGGSIRKALDYLAPYADPAKRWPGEQITPESPDLLLPHLLRAQRVYGGTRYGALLRMIPPSDATRSARAHLFWPDPAR
jgi:hypothetical protein